MANSAAAAAALIVLVGIAISSAPLPAEGAIACNTVLPRLAPCLLYLQRGGILTPSCCDGIRGLYRQATSIPDRQAACNCIKTLAPAVGAKPEFINTIPGKCQINISYRFSPSMDCSKVH